MKTRVFDGAAMKARREAAGMTRLQFQQRSGISRAYQKYLENGVPAGRPPGQRWPSDRLAQVIADALGCTVEDISHPDRVEADIA